MGSTIMGKLSQNETHFPNTAALLRDPTRKTAKLTLTNRNPQYKGAAEKMRRGERT